MVRKKQRTQEPADPSAPRLIKPPKRRLLGARRVVNGTRSPLPSSFKLFGRSFKVFSEHWQVLLSIAAVYFVLSLLLVRGLNETSDIPVLKQAFEKIFQDTTAGITTGLVVFGVLVRSIGATATSVGGAYQSMLLVVISLVIIWTLRHVIAGTKVGLKDAFYKSSYPLIPFVIVLFVMGIQLLPLILAGVLYNPVFTGGLAVTGTEKLIWSIGLIALVIWSLYLLSASLFALYIVSLPDVHPRQALRSARELVRFRRAAVIRRVLFLPIALLIIGAIIMLPIIMLAAGLAEWVFFGLTIISLIFIHTYFYILYREML